MSLKPCAVCGRYMPIDIRTCPYCGRRITSRVEVFWNVGVLMMALSAVAGVLYFFTDSLELQKIIDSFVRLWASIL